MSRKKLETDEDFLNNEPYKSIINILMLAPRFNEFYSKGLKTKELRDLIVKDYSICKERMDEQRLNMLSNFRSYLSINASDKVKLDQDTIKPGRYKKKKKNKETDEEYEVPGKSKIEGLFNHVLKKLERESWIKREAGVCSLVGEHKFALTLKKWHKDIITNSPNDSIDSIGEHTFYFDGIKKEEIEKSKEFGQMLGEIRSLIDYRLFGMMDIALASIKKRRASDMWEEFKSKSKLPPILLLYLWLQLLFLVQYKVRNLGLCIPINNVHPRNILKNLREINQDDKERYRLGWLAQFYITIEKALKNMLIELYSYDKDISDKIYKYEISVKFVENVMELEEIINKIISTLSEKLPYAIMLDNASCNIDNLPFFKLPEPDTKPPDIAWTETRYHVLDHVTEDVYSISRSPRSPPTISFYNSLSKMLILGSHFDRDLEYTSKFFFVDADFTQDSKQQKKSSIFDKFRDFRLSFDKNHSDIKDKIEHGDFPLNNIFYKNIEKDFMELQLIKTEGIEYVFYDGNGYLTQQAPFKNKQKLLLSLFLMSSFLTMPKLPKNPNELFSGRFSSQQNKGTMDIPIYDFTFTNPKCHTLDPVIALQYID